MAFDLKNKVSYVELTPELQALIDSKAAQADFLAHKNDNDIHITAQERQTWNAMLDEAKEYTDSMMDTIVGLIPDEGQTIIEIINTKVDNSVFEEWKATIHQIAYTGSYNDLVDKPASISFSDQANKALEADHAKEADHATEADHAAEADHAKNADTVNNIGVFMQPTQPTPTTDFALWFDTNNQILKAYYSGSWKSTRAVWA